MTKINTGGIPSQVGFSNNNSKYNKRDSTGKFSKSTPSMDKGRGLVNLETKEVYEPGPSLFSMKTQSGDSLMSILLKEREEAKQLSYEQYLQAKEYFEGLHSKQTKSLPKLPKPYLTGDPNNVLIIGDTHAPFTREGYLEFCREQQETYNCGTVIHIGDEVDNCAMSFHEQDPDGHSAGSEAEKAQNDLNKWYQVFPTVKVCIGNHSALVFRQAHASGIAKRFIKPYEEMWNAPKGWSWHTDIEHLGVLYTHGTGTSGDKAALTKALNMRQSVVQGHIHTVANIAYNASPKDLLFAMQVGCGIDDNQYAFNYAKENIKKSIISCGVVINGTQPILIPMKLN
jgi:predicted phosphodiesterase